MKQEKYCNFDHVRDALGKLVAASTLTASQVETLAGFGLDHTLGREKSRPQELRIRQNSQDDTISIIDASLAKGAKNRVEIAKLKDQE